MALWNFNNSKMNLLLLVMIDLGGDRSERKFVLLVDLVNPVK